MEESCNNGQQISDTARGMQLWPVKCCWDHEPHTYHTWWLTGAAQMKSWFSTMQSSHCREAPAALPTCLQEVGVDCCCRCSSWQWEHNWYKWCPLYLQDTLLILSPILLLMVTICFDWWALVWLGCGLNTHVKEDRWNCLPIKLLSAICSLPSASTQAVQWENFSPVKGWSGCLTVTSWHTSRRRSLTISWISLWQMPRNPSTGHCRACDTVTVRTDSSRCEMKECWKVTNHIVAYQW